MSLQTSLQLGNYPDPVASAPSVMAARPAENVQLGTVRLRRFRRLFAILNRVRKFESCRGRHRRASWEREATTARTAPNRHWAHRGADRQGQGGAGTVPPGRRGHPNGQAGRNGGRGFGRGETRGPDSRARLTATKVARRANWVWGTTQVYRLPARRYRPRRRTMPVRPRIATRVDRRDRRSIGLVSSAVGPLSLEGSRLSC